MKAYATIIVFDQADIRLSVATDINTLRRDLIEFILENEEQIAPDATFDEACAAVAEVCGHRVLFEETWIMTDGDDPQIPGLAGPEHLPEG